MNVRAWLSFAACGVGLLLGGCGASAPVSSTQVNALGGNWLLVGPMPASGLLIPPEFRLAVTLDVVDRNVVAGGLGDDFCGILQAPFVFGSSTTGTVGTDGSFNLQSPSDPETWTTVSIKGTVPKAGGLTWTGSYKSSFANSPFVPGCTRSQAGAFTATSFPLVSGVYAGTGSWKTIVDGVETTTPVTFQVALQQGATVTNPVTGESSFSNSVLNGNIRLQGISCFNSGVANSTSSVQGNEVQAVFAMNDGTTLTVLGTLTDPGEARMTTGLVVQITGKCVTRSAILNLLELDKQS
jgi:hypothetical protein